MTTNENGLNDRLLVDRVLRGDAAAVDLFVSRMSCIAGILSHLNRRRGSTLTEQDLLELSQDVFEQVWKRLETFRGEAVLETWVYNFCVNTIANRVRSANRRRTLELDASILPAQTSKSESLDENDAALLVSSLDGLPEIDRRIVRLRLFDSHTFDAVGERVGIPAESAKTRYYRALARLHDRLAGKFGEGNRP